MASFEVACVYVRARVRLRRLHRTGPATGSVGGCCGYTGICYILCTGMLCNGIMLYIYVVDTVLNCYNGGSSLPSPGSRGRVRCGPPLRVSGARRGWTSLPADAQPPAHRYRRSCTSFSKCEIAAGLQGLGVAAHTVHTTHDVQCACGGGPGGPGTTVQVHAEVSLQWSDHQIRPDLQRTITLKPPTMSPTLAAMLRNMGAMRPIMSLSDSCSG